MSANITINFADGTATSSVVSIALSDCSISPGAESGVSVAMASALTNVTATAAEVAIATALDAKFSGSAQIAIGWAGGQVPAVTLNNLRNDTTPATVTWPTASGPQAQILTPGDSVQLAGIVSA